MKAAFAHWESRIAPVFDVARQICLVEVAPGSGAREAEESLPEDLPVEKALRLAELGVDTLVCGAISRPLHEMILAYGIRVIPFVAGDLREVIQAWLGGGLDRNAFAMPGCCGRGRRWMPGRRRADQEAELVSGARREGNGSGRGQGRGRGQGDRGRGQGQARGRERLGRMGGRAAAGPAGTCVCTQCGQREVHERGVPCARRKCPRCGAKMTRE